MKIKIKYHNGVNVIQKISKGDWIDLRAAEDVILREGDFKLISLGVSMQLPEGTEAIVAPRSSTFKNYGIIMTNSIGVIDNSYNGDNDVWKFPALATRETHIRKNDRIAQFRLLPNQGAIEFETVDVLGNDDRGGIGSTGRS